MLSSIRRFSHTIYAKIFLFIVAIPFIFWGMGNIFSSGNQKVIVTIEKEKVSTQEFITYLNAYIPSGQEIDDKLIDKLLSDFIADKLISNEIKSYNINLSENSLAKIIKNERTFRKENTFSRIEYEKFLVKNSLNAIIFEANVSKQEKKKQLLNLIGGGVVPSIFSINMDFDKINQKRIVQLINLNDIFVQEIKISEDEIKSYFKTNKDKYNDTYKSVKFIKLNSKNLTGDDEFSDLFFKKIDEIDDFIVEGKNLDYILQKYNLENLKSATFNNLGRDKQSIKVELIPFELAKYVFNINETDTTVLIEHKDKYFIIELIKTEIIQKDIKDVSVKKDVLLTLKKQYKRKIISNLISRINKNNFKKTDFDNLSKEKKVPIEKIILKNKNDENILKKNLVNQIYAYPEKKVIVVADLDFKESFLVYVSQIENVSINENSTNYTEYFNLTKARITSGLYNTYDSYLRKKYDININYNALGIVKNSVK